MDYEKAYKDAMSRAKEIRDDLERYGSKAGIDDMEYIFPELAESEDERIRKWISDRLLANYSKEDNRVKEALVWLEKQKAPKHLEWSEEDEHYFQNLIMAVDSTFSDGNTKNWLQNRFKSLSPQPRVEWSEKDEEMYKRVCESYSALNAYIEGDPIISKEESDEIIKETEEELDWFESLCEKITEGEK